ncbi:hypothetical protein KSS87_018838 [Heliosperma pusillum]|nr:hypothetical protein KSS87_018838 [Heliosperma pusillum]
MGEEETTPPTPCLPLHPAIPEPHLSPNIHSSTPLPKFDPSRMVGIIKRKALIKDLAAVYHAECLDYCQQLLSYQRKWEETYKSEDLRTDTVRATKRAKKVR